jgi:hypothetical protein
VNTPIGAGVAVGVAVGSGVLVGVGNGLVAVVAGIGVSVDPHATSTTAIAMPIARNRIFFTTSPCFLESKPRNHIIDGMMRQTERDA